MEKFRFHVLGLPHCPTTKEHSACAFTANIWRFCQMMHGRGHTVYFYGVEGSDPPCTENVTVMPYLPQFKNHDWRRWYYPVNYDQPSDYWQMLNVGSAVQIAGRKQPGDTLCAISHAQQPVAAAHPDLLAVEYAVGYLGTFAACRVFPSYAHMAHCLGRDSRDPDGSFGDAVIPHYFDVADFPFVEKPQGDPYVLFVGRMVQRKGLKIAIEATRAAGVKLLLAGQGASIVELTNVTGGGNGYKQLTTDDGQTFTGNHFDYLGFIDTRRRAELMGNALALIAPTLYLEPFGAVMVEAQLCGTPAITTDWGAFPETVVHCMSGFRCHNFLEFVAALQAVGQLDRVYIRERAERLYALDAVAPQYEQYFGRLQGRG